MHYNIGAGPFTPVPAKKGPATLMRRCWKALEDYVKRQKKRLVALYQADVAQMAVSGKKPPRTILGSAEDEEAANEAIIRGIVAASPRAKLRPSIPY
jgi:hypothetical protein